MVFGRLMPEKPLVVAGLLAVVALTAIWQYNIALPVPALGMEHAVAVAIALVIIVLMDRKDLGAIGRAAANSAGRSRIFYALVVVAIAIVFLNMVSFSLADIGTLEAVGIGIGLVVIVAVLTGNASRLRRLKDASGARILAEAAIIAALSFTVTALAVGGGL